MKQFRFGFTLIEILIVIGIVGVLMGMVVVNLPNQGRNARDNRRKVDIEQIRAALEMYRTDQPNGNYPAALNVLVPAYIATLPRDPRTGVQYPYAPLPAGCTTAGPTFCTSYWININLETGGTHALSPLHIAN